MHGKEVVEPKGNYPHLEHKPMLDPEAFCPQRISLGGNETSVDDFLLLPHFCYTFPY